MDELVTMSKKIRIGWISNSAVGMSETFISDNLSQLQSWAEVKAWCGRKPNDKGRADVEYLDFDDVPQRLHHIIRSKLSRQNVLLANKQSKAKRLLKSKLEDFQPDLLWIEFGTTAEVIAPLLRELDIPYVINVHGYDVSKEFNRPEYRASFVAIANASHSIICASHHTRNLCIASGIRASLCHVIRYALDGEIIKRNPAIQTSTSPSFVHFGRLTAKKAPIVTLEAFRVAQQSLPEAQITFIGSGPLEIELRERIKNHKLQGSIHLIPAMERIQALELVQSKWIFCQHSVTSSDGDQEGFGLSPAEAALLEMPVISTFHNGIPEHVKDGLTGILTREWDIEGMAKAMVKLARDSALRNKMGAMGRSNILDLCSQEKRSSAIRQLLEE